MPTGCSAAKSPRAPTHIDARDVKSRQLLWFVALWAGGVLAVGAAAGLLRIALNAVLR